MSVTGGAPPAGTPSPSPARRAWWAKTLAGLTALAVVLGGIASFTDVADRVVDFFAPSQQAGIEQPADGTSVAHRVAVDGVAEPGSGQQQWLIVEIAAIGRFYPGPSPLSVDAAGLWRQEIFVGGNADARGDSYTIHLVELSDGAENYFADYRSTEETTGEVVGMTRLQLDEAGADFIDSRHVVRG